MNRVPVGVPRCGTDTFPQVDSHFRRPRPTAPRRHALGSAGALSRHSWPNPWPRWPCLQRNGLPVWRDTRLAASGSLVGSCRSSASGGRARTPLSQVSRSVAAAVNPSDPTGSRPCRRRGAAWWRSRCGPRTLRLLVRLHDFANVGLPEAATDTTHTSAPLIVSNRIFTMPAVCTERLVSRSWRRNSS